MTIPHDIPCASHPRLFDSRGEGEPHKVAAARHRLAVLTCRACPALAACQQYLLDCETSGARVDGVVAGRQWRRLRDRVPEIRACADCGTAIVKRGTPNIDRLRPDGTLMAKHAGRGLCDTCYDRHRQHGTLERFPRLTRPDARERGAA